MIDHFSINWRNTGHWDICSAHERLFCIRGQPGAFFVRDERESGGVTRDGFPTVDAAMAWICATLMYEANRCISIDDHSEKPAEPA
jgi:membrane-associated phospholipid phosphatase